MSHLRSERKQARHEAEINSTPSISHLMFRVDSIYEEMTRPAERPRITLVEKTDFGAR